MQIPASTGQAARFLGVTEPRLNDLVRRGKIIPAPSVYSGRRLWDRQHLISAATILGIDGVEDRLDGQHDEVGS